MCKESRLRHCQYGINKIPTVLIIQIKRYGFDSNGIIIKKKNLITFDLKLSLSQWISCNESSGNFTLSSIIRHHGDNTSSGHFDCICHVTRNDESHWEVCSDINVSIIDENTLHTPSVRGSVYILIYKLD